MLMFTGQKNFSLVRSLVGKRAEVKKVIQNWGLRITAIPLICTEGIIDVGIYEGNVNGATFHDFVTEKLCPYLLPFDGRNPRSVVILGKRTEVKIYIILKLLVTISGPLD